jgi:hypothetical protein
MKRGYTWKQVHFSGEAYADSNIVIVESAKKEYDGQSDHERMTNHAFDLLKEEEPEIWKKIMSMD